MERSRLKYLLLQVRDANDPMRMQEVDCFSRALGCHVRQIRVHDLIAGPPAAEQVHGADVVLMGGSGDYSVVQGGHWLAPTLRAVAELYASKKPTFASCWGFQAMALALGGTVVTDQARAEVGTYSIQLTQAGLRDPVLGGLGTTFLAFEGHQDIVTALPRNARLLATSASGIFQCFTFSDTPIYCTQFHPELDRPAFLERVVQYPEYVERLLGIPMDDFTSQCQDTPQANRLLGYFVQHVLTRGSEFLC